MKKRHYNKIINYIDSIENQSEIKPSELSKKINVNKKDIENVFKSLISDGHVINLTSKTDLEIIIAKDDYFDYSSLLKIIDDPITPPITIATKIGGVISKTIVKIIIGVIIGILILIIWSVYGDYILTIIGTV